MLATTSCASYLILYTIAAEIHEREIVLDSTAGSNFAAAINDTFYPPGTLLLACTEIYNLHKEGITSTVFENIFKSPIFSLEIKDQNNVHFLALFLEESFHLSM